MSIALVIADDHPVMRESLRTAFSVTDIEIIGEAATPSEALEQASDPRVDVLLLDMHWSQGAEQDSEDEGIEILQAIRSTRPDLAILMYSAEDSTDCIARCYRLGADGYLVKGVDDARLTSAVRAVDAGTEIWPESLSPWERTEKAPDDSDSERED